MKQLVVISGKGGTGKTCMVASFAALAGGKVLADCDVDAADLHLLLDPRIVQETKFKSGKEAEIRPRDCTGCGKCLRLCKFDAVKCDDPGDGAATKYSIDPISCEGCGVCVRFCPVDAITFEDAECGDWFISKTRFEPMVHAKLSIGAENSGKLVSLVRGQARELAEKEGLDLVIIDGPPGIGCPVIASVTGADLVLIVTEPTLSGKSDLARVARLADFFEVQALVCVNKWDINEAISCEIEAECEANGHRFVGRIPYDAAVPRSIVEGVPLVEYDEGPASRAIRTLWTEVEAAVVA